MAIKELWCVTFENQNLPFTTYLKCY